MHVPDHRTALQAAVCAQVFNVQSHRVQRGTNPIEVLGIDAKSRLDVCCVCSDVSCRPRHEGGLGAVVLLVRWHDVCLTEALTRENAATVARRSFARRSRRRKASKYTLVLACAYTLCKGEPTPTRGEGVLTLCLYKGFCIALMPLASFPRDT